MFICLIFNVIEFIVYLLRCSFVLLLICMFIFVYSVLVLFVSSFWLWHSDGGGSESPVSAGNPHPSLPQTQHGTRTLLPTLQPVHDRPGGIGSLQ